MLTQFQTKSQFYKLCAKLYVDLERRETSITLTYDRCIIVSETLGPVAHIETDTPAKADAWLLRQVDTGRGGTASLIEHWEYLCRHGLMQKRAA